MQQNAFGSDPRPFALCERSAHLPVWDCPRGSLDETLTQWSYCILHMPVNYLQKK